MHDTDGDLKISVTLTLQDYDYSWWGTSGSDGLWLGLGIGSRDMTNADMVLCEFKFHNATGDAFICFDKHSNNFASPPNDNQDNIVTQSTSKLFYFDNTRPELL